jgi:hypothetical protein
MKKYLIKITLFFAIVAVVDFGYGKVGDYLREHTRSGVSEKVHYICEQCDEDIIMMGSSRMQHHYVPQIFEDPLGMTCYNAGMDGNGILLSYGFLGMILERYTPKMIIYDVSGFDMYVDDNTKYLDFMKPYYHSEHESVAGIFNDVDAMERWKMCSSLYRYNSKLFQFIGDNIHTTSTLEKGYGPIYRTINYDPQVSIDENKKREVDTLKLDYLVKFIELTRKNDVNLVFVASPTYFGEARAAFNAPIRQLTDQEGVVFLDHFYDSLICSSKEYWSDGTHMNDKGARVFSQKIVGDIGKLLEE